MCSVITRTTTRVVFMVRTRAFVGVLPAGPMSALTRSYFTRSNHAVSVSAASTSAGRSPWYASIRSLSVCTSSPTTRAKLEVVIDSERGSGESGTKRDLYRDGPTKASAVDLEYLQDVELLPLQSHDDAPVTHIAHISDVHIRRNDRFEEYEHVFAKLYEGLRELKRSHPGSIAVIAGDVVHEKCNMHSNGADTAWEFFKSLSDIMPIVVIPGNHDGQVRNTSAKNALHTLLRDRVSTHPIHLLVPSGAYVYSNVVFGVSSIFDGKFVKAKSIANPERDDVVKIALYHGAVGQCTRTSTGYPLPQAVSAKVFQGYDLTLLGDIHKHTYLNGRQTMAYPGSLISQDFGETDDDHGWIEWDLAARKPTYHRVPNDYAHKSCDFIKGKVLFNGIEYSGAESIIKLLPKKAHLRIMHKDDLVAVNKFERSLLDALPNLTIKKISMLQESMVQCPPALTASDPGNLLNDQELLSFIAKSYPSLNREEVMETIEALAEELKIIDDHDELGAADWTPLMLKFNHLYGYGRDNVIDFTRLKDNGVVGLFAPNAYGKSTVLNILSIAMFGKTTSEGSLHPTVINETQQSFDTTLFFLSKGGIHCVVRKGTKSNMSKICKLYHLVSKEQASSFADEEAVCTEMFMGELYYLMGKSQGFTDTQKAIKNLAGSYDGFRLTSMCLQNGASVNSFISMPNANRKRMLMKLFNLDVLDKVHALVKPKLTSLQGTFNWLGKSLVELGNPDKMHTEFNSQLATVTNTLKSIEGQIKKLESDVAVTKASQRHVTASEVEVKEQLAALDTNVLVAKMEAVGKELVAVENEEAELLRKISDLALVVEREAILTTHRHFDLNKKAVLQRLQSEEEDQQSQLRPVYRVSYDGSTHEAIVKEFEELEQQFQASPANIKGLKFSDECECCKHNRRMLGQEETGRAMHYSRVKEQLDNMESDKRLVEENQKIQEYNQVVEKKLRNIQREKKEVSESRDECYELLEHQNKQHADQMSKVLNILKEQRRLSSEQHELQSTMANMARRRSELQQVLADIEHNQRVGKVVKEVNAALTKLNKEKEDVSKTHTDLIRRLATVERDVVLYHQQEEQYSRVGAEKAMYERLEHITSPNGYSLHMLKHYIPQMCQGVNSIIGLYMDRDVGMTLEGDTISLLSLPRQRGESPGCPISSFSGMEWFMVDVAIKIVLGKMARVPRSGLMFIDEGISVMDQDRMARIGELFDFLRDHFRYTFVISHIDTVEDHVDMRLYISKEGQFSKINNKFISE